MNPEEYMRQKAARAVEIADRRLVDSLGEPLQKPGFSEGTFANPAATAPMFDVSEALKACIRPAVVELPAKPERFAFGSVSIKGFWLAIQRVEFTPIDEIWGHLEVQSMVPDRDTDKRAAISYTKRVPLAVWNAGPPARAALVREVILAWMAHELDEHIYIDGERADDPHTRRGFLGFVK